MNKLNIVWQEDFLNSAKISKRTLRRWIQNKKIPPFDIVMSFQKKGWRKKTLDEFLNLTGETKNERN